MAAANDRNQVVNLLIKIGAQKDVLDNEGTSFLNTWFARPKLDLKAIAQPDSAPSTALGCTPLHRACLHGHIKSVNVLLEAGAQIDLVANAGTEIGRTPAQTAWRLVIRFYRVHEMTHL